MRADQVLTVKLEVNVGETVIMLLDKAQAGALLSDQNLHIEVEAAGTMTIPQALVVATTVRVRMIIPQVLVETIIVPVKSISLQVHPSEKVKNVLTNGRGQRAPTRQALQPDQVRILGPLETATVQARLDLVSANLLQQASRGSKLTNFHSRNALIA